MSAERTPYPAWWRRWAYLQTIPRTVGTEHGAVFILVALAVLAGSSLGDFAIALLIGILVGTYSSVFRATPLAITFKSGAVRVPLTAG